MVLSNLSKESKQVPYLMFSKERLTFDFSNALDNVSLSAPKL
jgi:hypothetical protein